MKTTKKLSIAAVLGAIVATSAVAPALAEGYSVSLNKSAHLVRTGDTIAATIAGLPDGDGIYVRECVAPGVAGTRPTTCAGIADTVWASTDATSQAQGASVFTGTVSVNVKLAFTAGNGTAVDCTVSSCGVLVRRDHLDPTDYSLDYFTPITFAPLFGVSVSKVSDIENAGENVSVTVAGLTTDQGVYVRLCQQPDTGTRPTNCDGQGVWGSLSAAMQQVGAVNADQAMTLAVKGKFGSTDCTKVVCGVFVRLDHTDPANTTRDTFVPLTFTAAAVTPVAKKISTVVTKNQIIFSIVGYKGVSLTLTVGSTVKTLTPTSNGYTFKVALAKGKTENVKVAKGKTALFTKKVKN